MNLEQILEQGSLRHQYQAEQFLKTLRTPWRALGRYESEQILWKLQKTKMLLLLMHCKKYAITLLCRHQSGYPHTLSQYNQGQSKGFIQTPIKSRRTSVLVLLYSTRQRQASVRGSLGPGIRGVKRALMQPRAECINRTRQLQQNIIKGRVGGLGGWIIRWLFRYECEHTAVDHGRMAVLASDSAHWAAM